MKREIKFRAWDFILKEYLPNVQNHINDREWAFGSMLKNERWIIEQYTGLKDKNGKEIYEGDIVKVNDDWETYRFMSGEIRQVYFHAGGFRLKPKEAEANGHWLEDDGEFKVIGNIHQNPELL